MASFPEQPAASIRGNQEISELADAWAVMAVQAILDPDEDQVLSNLALLLRQLSSASRSN
jgi:hypothetical protein